MKKPTILLTNLVVLMIMAVLSAPELAIGQDSTPGQGIRTFVVGPQCNRFGSWDAITRTCTLATDLTGSIAINVADATLDCAGHKVEGPGPGFGTGWTAGIFLNQQSENITIKNCEVSDHGRCINSANSSSNTFDSNILYDCGIGISVSEGSGNQILDNTIVNVTNPVSVHSTTGNFISGNTIDSGDFGIGASGWSVVTNNDISRQTVFAIGISGTFNIIANNHIHESAGIRMIFFQQEGPASNNVVAGNIIENGTGHIDCGTDPFCDSGISLTAFRAQLFLNNAFGEGLMDNNTITGNTIRNFPGSGIQLDNVGNNNVVSDNIITENGGGILLTHRCPTCENKIMRNDIFNNGGTPLVSSDSVWSQDFVRTLLGPLPVDIVGDDGMGNPVGNYWGRDCPSGPFFIAGVDSNDATVADSNPFGIPVAGLASVPTPPGCL